MVGDITEALAKTLRFEGGENDPKEQARIGTSFAGIRQDYYDLYTEEQGLPQKSVKALSSRERAEYYKGEYFDKPGFNTIDSDVGHILFDYGVNAGQGTATMALQEAVGVKTDGKLGPDTREATTNYINRNGKNALINDILDSRDQLYERLAENNPKDYGRYLKGWKNRVKALRPKDKQEPGKAGRLFDALHEWNTDETQTLVPATKKLIGKV